MADLPFADLEAAYERLAEALDVAGPANEALFLTKLALLQVQRSGNLPAFLSAVDAALRDLPAGDGAGR